MISIPLPISDLHSARDALILQAIHARSVVIAHLLDLLASTIFTEDRRRLATLLLRATSAPILAARPARPMDDPNPPDPQDPAPTSRAARHPRPPAPSPHHAPDLAQVLPRIERPPARAESDHPDPINNAAASAPTDHLRRGDPTPPAAPTRPGTNHTLNSPLLERRTQPTRAAALTSNAGAATHPP